MDASRNLIGRISPPFTTAGGIPLRALIQGPDGFGRIGVGAIYSAHMGVAALRPLYEFAFGDAESKSDAAILKMAYSETTHRVPLYGTYGIISDPVHDSSVVVNPSSFAARAKEGKAEILDAMLAAGLIKNTGVRVPMGYDVAFLYNLVGADTWEKASAADEADDDDEDEEA